MYSSWLNLVSYNMNPLDQFELELVVSIWFLEINTVILNMIYFIFFIFMLSSLIEGNKLFVEGSYFLDKIYFFVVNIVDQALGILGTRYGNLFFCLFMNILFFNFIGLLPYGFTNTSHISITFTYSFLIVLGILFIGLNLKGVGFFNNFIMQGVPAFLVYFIFVIDVISYSIRPISLGLRLFANMMAGHTLLHIVGTFIIALLKISIFVVFLCMVLYFFINVLEFVIAFLQSYVFTTLSSVYMIESILEGH